MASTLRLKCFEKKRFENPAKNCVFDTNLFSIFQSICVFKPLLRNALSTELVVLKLYPLHRYPVRKKNLIKHNIMFLKTIITSLWMCKKTS